MPVCIGEDTGERKEESGEHGDYTDLLEVLSGNYGIPVNQITITVEHSR